MPIRDAAGDDLVRLKHRSRDIEYNGIIPAIANGPVVFTPKGWEQMNASRRRRERYTLMYGLAVRTYNVTVVNDGIIVERK